MFIFKVHMSNFKAEDDTLFDVSYFYAMNRPRALEEINAEDVKRYINQDRLIMLTESYSEGGELVAEKVRQSGIEKKFGYDVTLYIAAEDYIAANNILKDWLDEGYMKTFKRTFEERMTEKYNEVPNAKPKKPKKDRRSAERN